MFTAERVTVTNSPTVVFDDGDGKTRVVVRNIGLYTVYLGGASVDTAKGFPLDPGESYRASGLGGRDDLYGITDVSECEVAVLYV